MKRSIIIILTAIALASIPFIVLAACSFSVGTFYHVGDTVTLTYTDAPSGSLLVLKNPNGLEIDSRSVSGNGSISYNIPATALTGNYTITLTGTGCNVSKTVIVAPVGAPPPLCFPGQICIPNPLKYDTFEDLVDSIMGFIFVLSLALAPVMVLIGAFYLLTAGGDPKRVKTANSIFIWTAVGLLIVFLAKGLAAAIRAVLGLTSP